jgi:hypothetical protein
MVRRMNLFLRSLLILLVLVLPLVLPGISQGRMEYVFPGERNLLIEGFLENYTIMRSDDFRFSKQMQLTSFRNTAQFELTVENLIKNWGLIERVDLFSVIRGVYDGVYDLNPDTYGDDAARFFYNGSTLTRYLKLPRAFVSDQPVVLPIVPVVKRAWGSGRNNVGYTENKLEWWHNDSSDENELRELYMDITAGRHWLRIGKQQIVWGKTDFFRLQDIPNSIDFGRHGFYDNWEDARIPQWSTRYQYQVGSFGPFDNIALELVWLWDDFEPTGLGQGGEPWANPFGENLRLFSQFFDASGVWGGQLGLDPWGSQNFTRGTQALWKENKYGSSISNSELGWRLEWRYKDWRFALTHWYGFDDNGYLHMINPWSAWEPYPGRPYRGLLEALSRGPGPFGPDPVLSTAFGQAMGLGFFPTPEGGFGVIEHPRKHTFGLAVDYFEPFTSTVWRVESSFTPKVLITSTDQLYWKDRVDVLQWCVGIDRPTYLFFLNPKKSFFLSTQIFGKHNLRHSGGEHTGMIDWAHTFTFTFMATTQYYRDRIIPLAWVGYSPQYNASTGGVSCEWLITDNWSLKAGANIIGGTRQEHDHWPWTLVANAPALVNALTDPSTIPFALNEAEFDRVQNWPLGIVKEGFGAYRDRDEMYFIMRYRF